tara:strand:- start:818 stop:1057 length:240 start_codon:yes stop_codon:yes gene_type:complete
MKKLLLLSAIITMAFSCKKERLNGSKEIMVGKWELNYTITYYKDYKRDRIDSFDTLIPGVNSNKVFINIKKKRKGFFGK